MKSYISEDIQPGDLILVGYHNYIVIAICKNYDSKKNLLRFYILNDTEASFNAFKLPRTNYIVRDQYFRIVKYDESLLNIEQLDKYLKIKRLLSEI